MAQSQTDFIALLLSHDSTDNENLRQPFIYKYTETYSHWYLSIFSQVYTNVQNTIFATNRCLLLATAHCN